MIEVRRRNSNGVVQFYGWYTENEFINKWNIDHFGNNDTAFVYQTEFRHFAHSVRTGMFRHGYHATVRYFCYVAYNEKGKLLTTDYLLGLKRKRDEERSKQFCKRNPNSYRCGNYVPGSKLRWRGSYYRPIHTTPERRWVHAWDDEEFAPKVRAKRNVKNLPNSWDDYPRYDWRNNNWKRYRKHQWKEKKEA